MKILHVGYSDLMGGGNIAAYRIHRAMVDEGYDSTMVVARKVSSDNTVIAPGFFRFDISRRLLHRAGRLMHKIRFGRGSKGLEYDAIGINVQKIATRLKANIVNLHWTHCSFVALRSVGQTEVPVVWTLHDMLNFTGGCHYTQDCRQFERRCGGCPLLGNLASSNDASRQIMSLKEKWLAKKPEAIVAPSRWMKKEVQLSSLLRNRRVEHISYSLGEHWFDELDRERIRREIGVPDGYMSLMFASNSGASDTRKGFDLLDEAMKIMRRKWPEQKMVVLVAGGLKSNVPKTIQDGVLQLDLGRLSVETEMRHAYASADVFVAPSRQDNLPLVVMESLACGTPVVGFRIGGFPDMITEPAMGYLAKPFDVGELADGIHEAGMTLSKDRFDRIRGVAKKMFSSSNIAKQYRQLYASLLND
ncbi:MAG: glycosyltransferase [Pirellulaceae bacterium]|nr:glycosyltransferase [Pirellulaceae bacterium]